MKEPDDTAEQGQTLRRCPRDDQQRRASRVRAGLGENAANERQDDEHQHPDRGALQDTDPVTDPGAQAGVLELAGQGDRVVCGVAGIRVIPEFQERNRHGFAFMSKAISSELGVEIGVSRIAAMMPAASK